jgi:hypothetical protein
LADFAQKMAGRLAWLAALVVTGRAFAQTSDAEPSVVSASLELVAPAGCGSDQELARAIRARSERIRIDATSARQLRIELRDGGSIVTTVLSLTEPNGRRSTRTLRASSCAEALDGAALVAAVSLDPTASTAAAVEVPAAPPPALPPPPVCPRCEPPSGPTVERPHVAWSAQLSFEAASGPAPSLMLGFGATGMLAYERSSVLSPALRASFSHFSRGNLAATGGRAEFSLDAGGLELCPLRARAGPLRLYPCPVRFTAGRLRASGSSTIDPQSRSRPWLTLGSSLVGLLKPSRSLELSLAAGAGWPLVRDRFQFEPLEFYRVSGVIWTLAAGAGVAFP